MIQSIEFQDDIWDTVRFMKRSSSNVPAHSKVFENELQKNFESRKRTL